MLGTEGDVVLGLEVVGGLLTPDFHLGVLLGALTDGAGVMREVGNA